MNTDTTVGNAALGLSSSVGIVTALNEYATIISLGLSLVGLLIGLTFHILNVRHRRKNDKIDAEILKQKLKDEILKELDNEQLIPGG